MATITIEQHEYEQLMQANRRDIEIEHEQMNKSSRDHGLCMTRPRNFRDAAFNIAIRHGVDIDGSFHPQVWLRRDDHNVYMTTTPFEEA